MITKENEINLLLIFAKYPQVGEVKTRLAKDTGATRAVKVYRQLVETVIKNTSDSAYDTWILYAPRGAQSDFKRWLGHTQFDFLPQHGDGLGERLEHAACQGKEKGAQKIALIGSDCPQIYSSTVNKAFKALEQCDVVIGPTEDGGYYLLAFKEVYASLFSGISWSTELVCKQTQDKALAAGLTVTTLETLFDIDTLSDLERWEQIT